MRIGSKSIFRQEALDLLLHNFYERLLEEPIVKKAFLIEEETHFEDGNDYTYFKLRDIPIEEKIYVPPKIENLPFRDNKFTMRERAKIFFKGRL